MKINSKKEKRVRRHTRIRSQVKGTAERPRLSVFRSNRFVWAQIIDDVLGQTLAAAGSKESKTQGTKRETPKGEAEAVGEALAKRAAEKKITRVVFDRGGYRYHGRVRAVAEGARKGGLEF